MTTEVKVAHGTGNELTYILSKVKQPRLELDNNTLGELSHIYIQDCGADGARIRLDHPNRYTFSGLNLQIRPVHPSELYLSEEKHVQILVLPKGYIYLTSNTNSTVKNILIRHLK